MAKKNTDENNLRQELSGLIEQLQLPELYKQSLKQRWLDQAIWADQKASTCRRWHYRLRLTTIVGCVLLPALVGINFQVGKDNPQFRAWFPYIPFALSQVIAISAAIEEFCRFGDRWRDYRKMAEDLKTEGWQYLQLSGPYQYQSSVSAQSFESTPAMQPASLTATSTQDSVSGGQSSPRSQTVTMPANHLSSYALFAGQVERIIKADVQDYVAELIKQQTRQEEKIEQYLKSSQPMIGDGRQFEFTNGASSGVQNISSVPSLGHLETQSDRPDAIAPSPTVVPMSLAPAPIALAPVTATPGSTLESAIAPPPDPSPDQSINSSTDASAAFTASPEISPEASANSAPTAMGDWNAAIAKAAHVLRGMSSAEGPGDGKDASAWMFNLVLLQAGLPSLGDDPNQVPSLVESLKQGRGQRVERSQAKAGDIVVSHDEQQIGIGLKDGCERVLSNSPSLAAFIWESDIDFDGSYGGPSTIYRLLN